MTQKDVTVSLVQITQYTRPTGQMVGKTTLFCLPGADYNQICEALLGAKFELVNPVKDAVTVSLVRITQDTRPAGKMEREETYFRLPGADYNQTFKALLGAKLELVNPVSG